jgi:hypothetical protein
LNCGQVCSCLPSSGSCFVGVAIEWLFTWREQRPSCFFLCSMSSSFLWQSSGDPKATHRLQGRPPSHALCSFLQREQARFIFPLPLAGRKQKIKKNKKNRKIENDGSPLAYNKKSFLGGARRLHQSCRRLGHYPSHRTTHIGVSI